ncbi:MAG TPA: sugar phosphate isomerase/epimerase family protein [Chloroflexaceae bacterium]|nr:sugar phosphate isomerase/epimerase family protein [Chloroflexaceae bacterium]
MNTISFMTANYVARELGYTMTGGWGQGDRATQAAFQPVATFGERFGAVLAGIVGLGFGAVDLWTAHLNPAWATPEQIATARELLAHHGLPVVSLAGWFGSTLAELEQTCALAAALGCRILGGSTSALEKDRAGALELLERYDLVLALENHPEKTPAELLAKVGAGHGGRLAACVDTGWFATQGYDAARAIEELGPAIAHVHLKDVLAAGAHNTCAYGEGVVPLEACVRALGRIGYTGGISVEHEPEHESPDEAARAGLALLRGWLAGP